VILPALACATRQSRKQSNALIVVGRDVVVVRRCGSERSVLQKRDVKHDVRARGGKSGLIHFVGWHARASSPEAEASFSNMFAGGGS
jgi:hypothetical protein